MGSNFAASRMSRRRLLSLAAAASAAMVARPALAGATRLSFDELYGKISVLGLEYSAKVKALAGQDVEMSGFMAPPLKAEAKFFVLTEIPMSICPFCSTDADWPDNIVVIYLDEAQTFMQPGIRIAVSGTLEVGSWTDPDTGFLSRMRLRGARYWVA
jgi:RNA polymerase subunit RPABC4/transcription elongation factor Spt4